MIMGIWNPASSMEKRNAIKAAAAVDGYAIGNEGLNAPKHNSTYDYDTLEQALLELKLETGKPVATTEEIGDYADPKLVELGDWIFPNVHAYWHAGIKIKEPQEAVVWTVEQYKKLSKQDKFVSFKEVGFPTSGDTGVSEEKQAEYYRLLQKTEVKFIYFEAYDGPWKQWEPVEPYWGLFRSDRSAKPVVSLFQRT
jgi:exo-beta-1,3-glucanase (GH17 family)